MCLIVNKEATAAFKARVGVITAHKLVKVQEDGRVTSVFMGSNYHPGYMYSSRIGIAQMTPSEIQMNKVSVGFHVCLTLREIEKIRQYGKYLDHRYQVLQVDCDLKDLIAVGHWEDFELSSRAGGYTEEEAVFKVMTVNQNSFNNIKAARLAYVPGHK